MGRLAAIDISKSVRELNIRKNRSFQGGKNRTTSANSLLTIQNCLKENSQGPFFVRTQILKIELSLGEESKR